MTEVVPTPADLERRRPFLESRMKELAHLVYLLDIPGALSRQEYEALQRGWDARSRSEIRGRMRTEYHRLKGYIEILDHYKGAAHGR